MENDLNQPRLDVAPMEMRPRRRFERTRSFFSNPRVLALVLLILYLLAIPLFYNLAFIGAMAAGTYNLSPLAFLLPALGWLVGVVGSGVLLGNGTKEVVGKGALLIVGMSAACVGVGLSIAFSG
ncbi:MAG: hypothetical protein FWD18_07985 [Micrococcales bacterium]|nr:hypothetical protein [Micrococcales bacterium]